MLDEELPSNVVHGSLRHAMSQNSVHFDAFLGQIRKGALMRIGQSYCQVEAAKMAAIFETI